MKLYVLISLFALFCSCSGQKSNENNNIMVYDTVDVSSQNISQVRKKTNVDLDSIKQEIFISKKQLKLSISDTVKYQFSLEDVGTEGNEGIAYYYNDSVRKAEINIYTSMWKIYLLYLFEKTDIKVIEQTYNIYENIQLVKEYSYTMDLNGVPLKKIDFNRVDVFQEFKEVVPFVLSK